MRANDLRYLLVGGVDNVHYSGKCCSQNQRFYRGGFHQSSARFVGWVRGVEQE